MWIWQNELNSMDKKKSKISFSVPYFWSHFPEIAIIKQFLMYPFRDVLGIYKHIKYIFVMYIPF